MDFDVDKLHREAEQKRKNKAESLLKIAEFLNKCGYKYIVVQYQGCGDEGESMESEGYKTDDDFKGSQYDGGEYIKDSDWIDGRSVPLPKDKWEWSRQQIEVKNCIKEYNQLHDTSIELNYMISDLIGYDWYNNEGGQGRIILDTVKKILYVEGQINTNAHVEIESTRYLDNSKPFEERVGKEIVDRGW